MSCPDCNKSILNNESSLIPDPLCQGDGCPDDVGCKDRLPSNCIDYNGGTLGCLNVVPGMTLNTVLAKVELACENNTSANDCKIKTNISDTCCGYLIDKLRSTSLDITTVNPSGCSTISIEEKPWVWGNLFLQNGFVTDVVTPAYGIKNDEVRFRGQMFRVAPTPSGSSLQLFTLPVIARPSELKVFQFIAANSSSSTSLVLVQLQVNTNGNVNILVRSFSLQPSSIYLSLDSISYIN